MNKIIMTLLIGMFFLTGVSAISVGDVYKQQQVNALDFNTFNLGCTFDSVTVNVLAFRTDFWFSCFSLKYRSATRDYIVTRPKWSIYYSLLGYVSCLTTNPKPVCIDGIESEVIAGHKTKVMALRQSLKQYQSSADVSATDFSFPAGALNPTATASP